MSNERYEKGLEEFRRHLGPETDAYLEKLKRIYPKFERINVEFPFGDIYADKSVLDDKTRELVTVAALTVQGFALPELSTPIKMAIHCGARKEEILEVITQMVAYCGFPAATNALLTADKVFQDLEI